MASAGLAEEHVPVSRSTILEMAEEGLYHADILGRGRDSIYGTPGYSYETFLVVTTNAEAAAMLSDQQARKYGMRDLPPGTERLGTPIVVTLE